MELIETMGAFLRDPFWSPYVAGIGIGILSWLTFLLCDHPLGVSTAFAKTAGLTEKAVRGPGVLEKPYYQETTPEVGWESMLVIGLFVGALAAAALSGTFDWVWVPSLWESKFGSNSILRGLVAVAGGICVGFGARWGCGCTSGHGISGALQLVISSWIAVLCFFVGGVATAMLMYYVV